MSGGGIKHTSSHGVITNNGFPKETLYLMVENCRSSVEVTWVEDSPPNIKFVGEFEPIVIFQSGRVGIEG